jgi:hypothetical protein
MLLRKGRSKTILESAIDSCLLAVEIYNKPRTAFRSEGYITLMVIAWTKLFHAYFNSTIGDRYYYKNKNRRFSIIDGERKAWDLKTCITKYNKLREAVAKNLEFFIRLRNKIEHRHIEKREVDVLIFGECQAFLFNFENLLVDLFGQEYAINETLVYSLQFAHLRTSQQKSASKSALSKDLSNIVNYVNDYRTALNENTFNSQEYSIKLLQIPKISNTNRSDLAVEYVKWDELDEEDKNAYEKVTTIIKDKKVRVEGTNVGKLRPGQVLIRVNNVLGDRFLNFYYNTCLCKLFSIRPGSNADDPFDTNTDYCHYDEAHNDYMYQESWPDFIIHIFQSDKVTKDQIQAACKNNEQWRVNNFRT